MAILKVLLYGDPRLHQKTMRVGELPLNFEQTLKDMWDTMYDDDGIGLSANQVGLDASFFIADFALHEPTLGREVFINPEIVSAEDSIEGEEGCLSVPGIREKVTRARKILLRYETLNRTVVEREYFDYPARVIQHEVDHLNGIVFVDRISSLKRSFIAPRLKRLAKQAQTGIAAQAVGE